MARGGLAQQQLNTTNAAAAGQAGQAGQIFGTDWSAIQNQLNPNLATTQALTQLPMQAANSALAGAQQSAAQRVAKTNNTAGYTSLADKFGRDKANADATAALQGSEAIQNLQNTGIKNAGNLFGMNEDTMAKLYGISADNTKTATQQHPFGFNLGPLGVKAG